MWPKASHTKIHPKGLKTLSIFPTCFPGTSAPASAKHLHKVLTSAIFIFFSIHAGFHPSEYSWQERISIPFVKKRGLFISMHFSFQVCFGASLPKKPSLFPQSTWQPVTVGRQRSAAPRAAICGRDKCKHRDSHQTETICTVTGKTKSKNKGQETQEQKPCLFPGDGVVLGGRTDHGTACPGRICRHSIAEAGTGCRCARCRAEVRSETPGMCVTS